MGCHALLQGIFLTQGLHPGSPTLHVDSLLSEPQESPQRFKEGTKNSPEPPVNQPGLRTLASESELVVCFLSPWEITLKHVPPSYLYPAACPLGLKSGHISL